MHEKSYRSILKAVSYRVTGTINTMLISFFITDSFKMAASIGLIEVISKIALYYLHERVWNKIKFGKESKLPPEYNI